MSFKVPDLAWQRVLYVALVAVATSIVPCQVHAATTSPTLHQLRGHVLAEASETPIVGTLAATTPLHLLIGLPWRNQPKLNALITSLYDPKNAQYRHFLTPAAFAAQFGPTQRDYNAVAAFAKSAGFVVAPALSSRFAVAITGSAAAVQKAFHVTLQKRRRPDGSIFFETDREPSIATNVPVLHIAGLDSFFVDKPRARTLAVNAPDPGSGPGGLFTGNDLRNAYAPGTKLNGAGQCVGIAAEDGIWPPDIFGYEYKFGLPKLLPTIVTVGGFKGIASRDKRGLTDEADHDVDLALAMAPGLMGISVYEGGAKPPFAAPTDDILAAMASPPTGDPLCLQLAVPFLFGLDQISNNSLIQMAAQGQTLFSSSDDETCRPFVSFPIIRGSAFVTVVGGTELSMNGKGASWNSEAIWTGGVGGVAAAPIPSFQQQLSIAAGQQFRMYPDVAAVADGLTTGGGTSAAAVIWAGFMALVNQSAMQMGVGPVGWLNPALYAIAQVPTLYARDFHDIVGGPSVNCSDRALAIPMTAVAGWDFFTGLGTPTVHLINDLASPPNLGPFRKIDVQITTANGLRSDSSATLSLGGSIQSTLVLKAENGPAFGSNSIKHVAFDFGLPQPFSAFRTFTITLNGTTHTGYLESDDEWKIQAVTIHAFNSLASNSPQACLVSLHSEDPNLPVADLFTGSATFTMTVPSGCP